MNNFIIYQHNCTTIYVLKLNILIYTYECELNQYTIKLKYHLAFNGGYSLSKVNQHFIHT